MLGNLTHVGDRICDKIAQRWMRTRVRCSQHNTLVKRVRKENIWRVNGQQTSAWHQLASQINQSFVSNGY